MPLFDTIEYFLKTFVCFSLSFLNYTLRGRVGIVQDEMVKKWLLVECLNNDSYCII